MISQFFSSQSHKAWVAGVLGALLSPLFELLNGSGQITLRSVGVAAGLGVVSAIATFAVPNRPGPLPWQEPATDSFAAPATNLMVLPVPRIAGLPVPGYTVDDEPGRHAAIR